MRVVTVRPAWLQLVAVFGGFLIGPSVSLAVSRSLTPDSELVQTAAAFGFVLVFVGGTLIWAGVGFAAVIFRAIRTLIPGTSLKSEPRELTERVAPPGYGAYLVLGLLVGIGVGLLAGVATELSVEAATATWTLTGLGYGTFLWAAAHQGYLPFVEPE